MLNDYLPQRVNSGPWVPAYTLYHLRSLPVETQFILPICSLATPYSEIAGLGEYVLPPLFHEALNDDLKQRLANRITQCFPIYDSDENSKRVKVVELPHLELPEKKSPRVLSFSVDTAIEEHGPHLPLGTDTIQSYNVLRHLAEEFDGFELGRPLEYGQLTWGLPFGFSIDITTDLLSQYVTKYCKAITNWLRPDALYVVDVHGSITHRQAIIDGIEKSNAKRWAFRWLYDPLAKFAFERSDQHAGGVETILVENVSKELLDPDWWPHRIDDIAEHQMSFEKAVELTPDLNGFCDYVQEQNPNGVIGDITNYRRLDLSEVFGQMLDLARSDVQQLLNEDQSQTQDAGQDLW